MKSLTNEMETLIYKNVKENYPHNWRQDAITRVLFSSLKKLFHGKKIHSPGNTIKTFWHLYHLKDELDPVCADIAFILQVSYHDGQVAEGVVFHDVAEKDSGKNTFSNLNKNKYRKIISHAPHSQLLLYDYDNITGMAFPSTAESVIGNQPHTWHSWVPYTHAVTVPANIALTLDNKTTALYKVALPFSYQLCYRYLFGLDLDFGRTSLETANGINTKRGNPKYMILIAASHGGAEPLNELDFNYKKYIEFE